MTTVVTIEPVESIAEPRQPGRPDEGVPFAVSKRFDYSVEPKRVKSKRRNQRRVFTDEGAKPFFLKRDSSPSSDSIMSLPSWGSSSSSSNSASSDEPSSNKLDRYKSSARAYFSPFFQFTRRKASLHGTEDEEQSGKLFDENRVPLPFMFTTLMQEPVPFRSRRGMLPGADVDARISFYRRMDDDKHDPLMFKVFANQSSHSSLRQLVDCCPTS
jgi:hypothetical protein